MELMEAGNASVFFFAQPLTGTFFSWLLLGERLNVGFFLGRRAYHGRGGDFLTSLPGPWDIRRSPHRPSNRRIA